jgi:hypothetical protein
MKYILIAFTFLFASSVFAMDAASEHEQNVQQRLKETPEMSSWCKNRLEYYESKRKKYEGKVKEDPNRGWYQMKLRYYNRQLKEWTDYCSKPKEDGK